MASLVGQNEISTFTSPTNGQAPIDANVVRSNDNTIKTAFNAHDDDPTLHVQDDLAASRPAAGTAGRKWLDNDTLRLYYDNGSLWEEIAYAPLTSGTVRLADGTAAAPAYSFSSDTNTGIYRSGNDQLAFSTGGTKRVEIVGGTTTVTGSLGVTSSIQVGTNPSTAGPGVGLSNTGSITARDAANANNLSLLTLTASDVTQVAAGASRTLQLCTASTASIGFFNTVPAARQTATGSRGGNAALASLLTALAAYGIIVDSTTV